ncbi:hypothetical protein, partial [Brachyspira hyodysenteriae]|uniref:hypothetical protein n=1 Tax=Brachyspira hyodysenteriae TaxID=159 RepID=UPI0019D3CC49
VVDTLIRQATCDVVLVKFGTSQFNRWLVPMGGGPNSKAAIQLLPALVTLGDAPEIRLCQVIAPSDSNPDITVVEQAKQYL